MKQYEKEVIQAQLDNEKAVLKKLEANYMDALEEIETKIAILLGRADSDQQHVVYQIEFQQSLKKQIEAILETLHSNEFETISEYLTHSYEEGYIGALYSLQQQGVPFLFPLDQEQIIAAIQHETMLSESLYKVLGKDTKELSKKIAGEISRGIATGAMYSEIARNVASHARIPRNNAMRIARTESHRIQCKASMDTCYKAKDKGAEVLKEWNATLDARTRESHMRVDRERRELDKRFSNGLMYPGEPGAKAEEVINCRCSLNQRARWALDIEETAALGKVSEMSEERKKAIANKLNVPVEELEQYSGQIVPIKARNYEDFKRQYKQIWRYEGSDLEKEAEARIASYKKGKTQQLGRSNVQKINNQDTLEKIGKSSSISLNDDDIKAVYDYMSAKSYVVNEKLRTGEALTEEEMEFVARLDAALDKMPTYEGNLQRSLYFYSDDDVEAFMSKYKIGEPITYNEFLSTTKSEIYNLEGQVQIYIQNAKNGRDISSINAKEQEVLYKQGSVFNVINIVEQNGKHYILLGEKE